MLIAFLAATLVVWFEAIWLVADLAMLNFEKSQHAFKPIPAPGNWIEQPVLDKKAAIDVFEASATSWQILVCNTAMKRAARTFKQRCGGEFVIVQSVPHVSL